MLTLWRPHRDLFRWGREFDEMLRWPDGDGDALFTPAVDIEEHKDAFVLRADLPGVVEKDIEVTVHEGVLLLSGKRSSSREDKTEHGLYRERRHGSFRREFRLGEAVNAEAISATYQSGVLTVTLPKKEQNKPMQIPVKGS